jgi:hypothetical protein
MGKSLESDNLEDKDYLTAWQDIYSHICCVDRCHRETSGQETGLILFGADISILGECRDNQH